MIRLVCPADHELVASNVDPVVPNDARGLQILGKGMIGVSTYYFAQVILRDLKKKEFAGTCWLEESILNTWAGNGKSAVHSVFIADM